MEPRRLSVPLSVLDRSAVRRGQEPAEAVRDTVEFARQVEALGYRRFWVSEHHSVPGVAGSAPTVLASAIAANTSRIRVGTGGVMLPNHQPLVVAEQFGTLEALYPGRIDMGLGRSVGFTSGIRAALGRGREDAARFGEQLQELLGYFAGQQSAYPGVHGYPAEGLRVPAFVLATGSGAVTAAEAGLALVIAPVSGVDKLVERVSDYRERFRPSPMWSRPYVLLSVAVAVADTADRARRLLLPEAWSLVRSRTRGSFPPLLPPEAIPEPNEREATLLADALRHQLHGTPKSVRDELAALVATTTADEVLVTTSTYDRADLLASYAALADLTTA